MKVYLISGGSRIEPKLFYFHGEKYFIPHSVILGPPLIFAAIYAESGSRSPDVRLNNLNSPAACGYVADKIRGLCSGKSEGEEKGIKGIKERPCVISNGTGPKARPAPASVLIRSRSIAISSLTLVTLAVSLALIMPSKSNKNIMNNLSRRPQLAVDPHIMPMGQQYNQRAPDN